ncbi:MAG: NUDIX domain-containing protein [Clostridiales bacterium]|nr:NUDIX domain-containing protein [Clostridiales bacterium]
MSIRNAAKALIIDNGKMLAVKCQNSIGEMLSGLPNGAIYYDLPGGGQNQYETLEEAVKRECLEETGHTIIVERLAAIYEEISTNEEYRAKWGDYAHKVHFLFVCQIIDKSANPLPETDFDMLEPEWIDIASIKSDFPLYPRIIRDNLEQVLMSEHVLYLGSEHV